MKLFSLPNLLTLCNLLCGCIAIVFAFDGNLVWSAYFVGIACVFDFLDGFVARALKMHSPIGKDLDSLADMVTFGVVPGVVMYQMIKWSVFPYAQCVNIFNGDGVGFNAVWNLANNESDCRWIQFLPYLGLMIPLFSALRLAKFNNDTRQSDSFIGVPTPANSILICSFVLILNSVMYAHVDWKPDPSRVGTITSGNFDSSNLQWEIVRWTLLNPWVLIGITLVMSLLLISEIPLFALKFKKFGWKGNEVRYIFLMLSVAMTVLLKFIALPLVIVLYILMSIANNLLKPQSRRDTEDLQQ